MIRTLRRVQPISNLRSLYLFMERNIKTVASILIAILLMKTLTLQEYGIYSLFIGTTFYLSFFASFGFLTSYRRVVSQFLYQQDFARLNWLVNFTAVFRAASVLLTIGVCYFFCSEKLVPGNLSEYSTHFLLFGISVFFVLQTYVFRKVLEAAYLQKYLMSSDLILLFTKFALIAFVYLSGFGLVEVLVVDIICNFALFALIFVYYLTTFNAKYKTRFLLAGTTQAKMFKTVFQGTKTHSLNEAAATLLGFTTDFFIIIYFLEPVSLAYYAFSVKISELVSQLHPFQRIKKIITPTMIAKFVESNDQKELNTIFQVLTKISAFCVLPILTIFVVWGNNFIMHVIDPRFLPSYNILVILLIHVLISTLPFALPLQLLEKQTSIIISKIILFLNIGLSVIFVQLWGIAGVALAALTTVVIKKLAELVMAKKHAGVSLPRFELLQIVINCVALGGVAFLLKPYINGIFTFCIFGILAALVYLFISKINNAFKHSESHLIRNASLLTSLTF